MAVLSVANGLKSEPSLREGQILIVPRQDETLPAQVEPSNASWRRYVRPAREKGYVEISTRTARFAGLAVDERGHLRVSAVRAFNNLLGGGGTHPAVPERLLRLLVKVSDTFGGRPIQVISGYRTASYFQDSKHKVSAAVDFAIAGVPNAVVRDYLRQFEDVGVGFYPNSSFVHLDVRNHSAYWVDYAGPGEPPRSSPNGPKFPRGTERRLLAELDDVLEHATKAFEQVGTGTHRTAPKRPVPSLPARRTEDQEGRSGGEPTRTSQRLSD